MVKKRQGSHQTYGGWEPHLCVDCGRKLTLKDAAMCNYDHTTKQAWTLCNQCLHARRKAA